MTEDQREKRNAYRREWAKNNPDKIRAQQERYWAKKSGEKLEEPKVEILFTLDPDAFPPEKAYDTDAGFDLRAISDTLIYQNGTTVQTGVHVSIPKGYTGKITGRSGMNFRRSIICPQGTIDAGYTGAVQVRLYALDGSKFVSRGDKIAQLIFEKLPDVELKQVEELPDSERKDNGFGSTGR